MSTKPRRKWWKPIYAQAVFQFRSSRRQASQREAFCGGRRLSSIPTTVYCVSLFMLGMFSVFFATMIFGADSLVNQFLFFPAPYSEASWEEPDFMYENLMLETTDGVKINAWYLPADEKKESPGVILFSHGNAGNLSGWGYAAEDLRKRFNVSVLIYDYRGYGRSEGKPTVPGILLDARAARAWLCQKHTLKPEELIYQGRSLGGAVAIDLATENGARGLIVESSFTSIPDMAKLMVSFLPHKSLIKHQLNSLEKIETFSAPYLQCHGNMDSVIPYEQGIALFKACPAKKKQFVRLRNRDHNDPLPEYYFRELGTFLKTTEHNML